MAAPEPKSPRATSATSTATAPASAAKPASAKPAAKRKGGRGRWLRRIFFWFPLALVIGRRGRRAEPGFVDAAGQAIGHPLCAGRWHGRARLAVDRLVFAAGAHRNRGPRSLRRTVAEVAAVRGDKSLWALAMNHHDLGQFDIEQPNVHVVLRDDGSNLEDFLRSAADRAQRRARPISVAIKCRGGPGHDRRSTDATQLSVSRPGAGAALARGRRSVAQFANERQVHRWPQHSTDCRCWSSAEMGDQAHPLGKGRMTLPLRSIAARRPRTAAPPPAGRAQLAGRLTVALDGNWGEGDDWRRRRCSKGKSTSPICCSRPPSWDRTGWKWPNLHAPCRIVGKGGQIDIEQLLVDCDLGNLQVTGSVNTADLTRRQSCQPRCRTKPCQITGRLDLVRLAALFPPRCRCGRDRDHGRRVEPRR